MKMTVAPFNFLVASQECNTAALGFPRLAGLGVDVGPGRVEIARTGVMFLGIEIGGSKLQLGVGAGDGGPLAALERLEVDPARGGEGIRRQVEGAAKSLIQSHDIAAVGMAGSGGPVRSADGKTITSFQVAGWDDFPLVEWVASREFGLPTVLENDSNLAGLGELLLERAETRKWFSTATWAAALGAAVIDGRLFPGGGAAVAEIGHLRRGRTWRGPNRRSKRRPAAGPSLRRLAGDSPKAAPRQGSRRRFAGSLRRTDRATVWKGGAGGDCGGKSLGGTCVSPWPPHLWVGPCPGGDAVGP